MNDKQIFFRFLRYFTVCCVTGIALVAGIIFVVDPFYHYHSPWFDIPIILEDEVYQTAGASRNLEYSSAIVGTSMTHNYHTSWFDEELGWDTMKLSYSGAESNDLQAIFGQIDQKDGPLLNIFMDINTYQITNSSDSVRVDRPEYLYDHNPLNDYKYLLNHDVFTTSVKRVADRFSGVQDNIDSAYVWKDDIRFGSQFALDFCRWDRHVMLTEKDALNQPHYAVSGALSPEITSKLETCRDNLNNILPFIESHPETEFYVIFPPYSMLSWESIVIKGDLEDILAIYHYTMDTLLDYENVHVYYFQLEPEIITNLDNYHDNAHHKPEINRYIFDCVKNNTHLVTHDNLNEQITAMYNYAKDYPYETLWQ